MSDGTATPDPEREPEPSAWPQPGATPQPGDGSQPGAPQPGAPWPAGYGETTGAPAGPPAPGPGPAYGPPGQAGQPDPGAWPPAGQPAQPGYGQPDYNQPGYTAPGYAQPGATPGGYPPPSAGAYPPAAYGSAPYAPGQYAPPPARRTDGVSIAALVTAILGLAIVPLVLGILGLRRTKRDGTQGRGLAITGIVLGALEIVGWIAFISVIVFGVSQYQNRIDTLRSECAAGQMASCDDLYQEALPDSDEEQFGWTCGGRTDGGASCEISGAVAYGDSPELDALWDACAAGDMAACDQLYSSSPTGSEYEEFGDTCGGQSSGGAYCDGGGAEGTDDSGTTDPGLGDALGGSYGDDPELDALWDSCQAGSGSACDDLYWASPGGSEYEQFGTTCGGRVEVAWSCAEEIGA